MVQARQITAITVEPHVQLDLANLRKVGFLFCLREDDNLDLVYQNGRLLLIGPAENPQAVIYAAVDDINPTNEATSYLIYLGPNEINVLGERWYERASIEVMVDQFPFDLPGFAAVYRTVKFHRGLWAEMAAEAASEAVPQARRPGGRRGVRKDKDRV